MEGALFNLKVLGVSHCIAGPYCTKLLAGLGADVIKVEPPDGGDPARRMGPFPGDVPDSEKSGLFLYLNTNKKGITLNLKTETGRRIFKELVKDVDILVENFEPRVMPSLGLDYETLEKINPKLVMASISNFGQTGPYRDYKAQEITVFALGGTMYLTGDPAYEPIKEGGSPSQYWAGENAAAAILAAIYSRRQTSEGQHIDVSVLESVIAFLDVNTLGWYRDRVARTRQGNWKGGAGEGIYPCRDGYIGVEVPLARHMPILAELTGIKEFTDPDIGYMMFGMAVNPDKMNSLLLPWLMERDKEEIYQSAQKLRLPFANVHTPEDLLSWSQYQARGFFVDIDHPKAGKLPYPRGPFIMHETPWKTERAPLLGEHNEEIYCQRLGYSKQELVRLTEIGVI